MVTMPVPQDFYVTSGFGPRAGGFHYGTDFGRAGGSGGQPVYAVKAGTVTRAGTASGFGRWVTIDHPASNGGGETVYGHIIPEVAAGRQVREGQRIARIDPSTATNGGVAPHLHLEWHRYVWSPPGPDRLDPMTMLRGAAHPGASAPSQGDPMNADPVWLPDVLKAAGLTCDVYPGAMQRGHGDFRSIWGVVAHHTGAPATSTPGPRAIAQHPTLGLCSQLYLGRDGRFTLCGVGIAWHAGPGSYPGIATNNANAVTIGIEAENSGTEGWSKAQYGSYVTGIAAILNRLGLPASRCIGHKEWAGRSQGKWDPGGIDMAVFRADIAREQTRLKGGGVPPRPVENKIDTEAKIAAAWIGERLFEGERDAKDGGKYADFKGGSIYWNDEVHRANGNAIAVPSHIYETWQALDWERGFLGYPVRRHTVIKDVGDIQAFQGGTIYRRYGHDGYVVRGVIGSRWAAEGHETGPLGWPVSDEEDYDGGRRQRFEHGWLYWSPSGAVKIEEDK